MGCAPPIMLSMNLLAYSGYIECQSIMYLCLPRKGNGVLIYYYYSVLPPTQKEGSYKFNVCICVDTQIHTSVCGIVDTKFYNYGLLLKNYNLVFIIKQATTEFLAVLFSVEDCIFRGGGRF